MTKVSQTTICRSQISTPFKIRMPKALSLSLKNLRDLLEILRVPIRVMREATEKIHPEIEDTHPDRILEIEVTVETTEDEIRAQVTQAAIVEAVLAVMIENEAGKAIAEIAKEAISMIGKMTAEEMIAGIGIPVGMIAIESVIIQEESVTCCNLQERLSKC